MRQEQFRAPPALTVSGSPVQSPATKVAEDLPRGIVARRAGHTPARMRTCTAHVKAGKWAAIVAIAEQRPRREHLIELQPAMKNVTAHQAEGPLQIERAHDLTPEHRYLEIGRKAIHRLDHEIRDALAMRIPGLAAGKLRCDML